MTGTQVVGMTHCCIKKDDIDNKKELDMHRTETLLHLSGTQLLKYGDFHRYYCVLKSLNRVLERDFKMFMTDVRTDIHIQTYISYRQKQLLNPASAYTV